MPRIAPLALTLLLATIALGQNSAPSSHMVFDDNFAGDIIVNQVRVPKAGHAMYTYYEALGWRGKGAGYAGIQVHPRAHNFIFSIWDHKAHKGPIRAIHHGPGTETKPFGGEGTGLKSWNFELGWKTDVWYTLVARTWPDGENTNFGFWTRAGDTKKWTHMVTMNVAAADAKFEGSTDAFIEDWVNSGIHPRTTNLREGWKRASDGQWKPFAQGRYSVNSWDLKPGKRSYDLRTNWDGGIGKDEAGQFYYMTAGGKQTKPTTTNPSKHTITRADKTPSFEPIQIESIEAEIKEGKLNVRWQNEATTSPQFSYEIAIFDNATGEGKPVFKSQHNVAHDRATTIDTKAADLKEKGYFLHLRIQDIFDNQSKWKIVKL